MFEISYLDGKIQRQRAPRIFAEARDEGISSTKFAISGTFEVKLTPRSDTADNKTLGRMTIDKRWQGDLEGASKGEMLTAGTGVEGSAGYVAIETMTGTLNGRKGTFILQHNGIMSRGEGQLTIIVVPDSGTDQLAGLAGKMTIKIENGKHFYDFEYTLAH